MGSKFSKFVTGAGATAGRFFSSLTYVLSALLIYITLSVLTYMWLAFQLAPAHGKASFIAYEVATGGDPFNFAGDLQQYNLLWVWILIFHAISWLIVPIVAATAVDLAFNAWEEKRLELDERLLDQMSEIIGGQLGIPQEEARRRAFEARESMKKKVKKEGG
jgi:hypothetical protein